MSWSAGLWANLTCSRTAVSPAAIWRTDCRRQRAIMGGFEDLPLAKAAIVAVESLSTTNRVWGGHDLVTHSRAILAAMASSKFISRALYGPAHHFCLMAVRHSWRATNCSTSVSWLGPLDRPLPARWRSAIGVMILPRWYASILRLLLSPMRQRKLWSAIYRLCRKHAQTVGRRLCRRAW